MTGQRSRCEEWGSQFASSPTVNLHRAHAFAFIPVTDNVPVSFTLRRTLSLNFIRALCSLSAIPCRFALGLTPSARTLIQSKWLQANAEPGQRPRNAVPSGCNQLILPPPSSTFSQAGRPHQPPPQTQAPNHRQCINLGQFSCAIMTKVSDKRHLSNSFKTRSATSSRRCVRAPQNNQAMAQPGQLWAGTALCKRINCSARERMGVKQWQRFRALVLFRCALPRTPCFYGPPFSRPSPQTSRNNPYQELVQHQIKNNSTPSGTPLLSFTWCRLHAFNWHARCGKRSPRVPVSSSRC